MSDMNQTYVPEITVCNKTLGFGRCLDGSCYELFRSCDGFADCNDGYDEAGCKLFENFVRFSSRGYIIYHGLRGPDLRINK